MRIAAVILAGGHGRRLGGVNKALLELGEGRFIDRAIAAASGCSPILVAVGHTPFPVPEPAETVLDLDAHYEGPLAGVAAAVAVLAGRADALLSLAVDTPGFPSDFLARARPLLDGADVVLGAFGGQDYPTNGLWRLGALDFLPDAVRAGSAPRSLKRLAEGLMAARIDYADSAATDPFRNANTPEDLAFLRGLERDAR